MQRDDDRDRAIDRALRESLGARVTALPEMHAGEHLDGERLAAWSDGSLRPDEATMIERHLADCAHCQQLLAVFARTSPPQVTSEPLWRRWRLQWLVPIATAATAVAIWVAAPRPQPAPAAPPTAAQTGERETAQTQHRIAAPAEPAPPAPSDQPREKALARVLRSPTDALAKKETLERREEPKERADESAKPSASPVPAAPQLRGVTTASENAAQTADAAPTVQGNARARDEKPAPSLAGAVPTRPTPQPRLPPAPPDVPRATMWSRSHHAGLRHPSRSRPRTHRLGGASSEAVRSNVPRTPAPIGRRRRRCPQRVSSQPECRPRRPSAGSWAAQASCS